MKIGDITELTVTGIGCNMEGIARHGGITAFVPFVDIGERVKAKVTRVQKDYFFAEPVEIIESSPHRVKPPCIHFGKCGGCDCQHLSYARQTELKSQALADTIYKISGVKAYPAKLISGSKQYYYRNKLQMPIAMKNRLKIGFFEKDSHKPVNMTRCLLHAEWADKVIASVREYAAEAGVSAYDESTHKGILRHILARRIGQHISVTLVVNSDGLPKYSKLADILEYSIGDFSLHYSVNTKKTNAVTGDTVVTLAGLSSVKYESLGIEASASPLSFMQINDEVRDLLYSHVIESAGFSDTVIDAYSGGGLLTALLAKKAGRVYGIEIVRQAVEDSNKLMADNRIDNVENILGDTAEVLPDLIERLKGERGEQAISVVLDPPRKGCEAPVISALLRAKPRDIIYISCNPATFARDAARLSGDYRLESVVPFDMFPNTKHIELVARLSREGGLARSIY